MPGTSPGKEPGPLDVGAGELVGPDDVGDDAGAVVLVGVGVDVVGAAVVVGDEVGEVVGDEVGLQVGCQVVA